MEETIIARSDDQMLKPKKPLRTVLRKSSQPEVFPLEVEQLLDVLARIEVRRQLRLRA